jgi:hypothetical protein
LNKIAEAFSVLEPIEKEVKDKNKYLVHMLKGKCSDRIKEHGKAGEEFEAALKLCEQGIAKQLQSDVKFRLGWSLVRSGDDKDRGIELLREA